MDCFFPNSIFFSFSFIQLCRPKTFAPSRSVSYAEGLGKIFSQWAAVSSSDWQICWRQGPFLARFPFSSVPPVQRNTSRLRGSYLMPHRELINKSDPALPPSRLLSLPCLSPPAWAPLYLSLLISQNIPSNKEVIISAQSHIQRLQGGGAGWTKINQRSNDLIWNLLSPRLHHPHPHTHTHVSSLAIV